MKVSLILVKSGVVLLIRIDTCGVPESGIIKELFVDDAQQVFAGLVKTETVDYDNHFHSWMICPQGSKAIHKLKDSFSLHWPRMLLSISQDCFFVILKHAI